MQVRGRGIRAPGQRSQGEQCSFNLEAAPTIQIHMSSLNGTSLIQALPDSGADVSVASLSFLASLSEHQANLLPSDGTPRAVNGMTMSSVGKLPVVMSFGAKEFSDEVHIFREVKGALVSWRAAKGLGILPPHLVTSNVAQVTAPPSEPALPTHEFMAEFPSAFNDTIDTMEGEEICITLRENAKPFCVRAPRTVPFAYREKLKAELDLLQQQGIIAPVTTPTEWCAPNLLDRMSLLNSPAIPAIAHGCLFIHLMVFFR